MKKIIIVILMFVSSVAFAVKPLDGMWFDPDENGRGATIEIQNGVMVLTYFGYAQDGTSTWWQGVATEVGFNSGVYQGSFVTFYDGQCIGCPYNPPAATADSIGDFTIEFDTWTTGTMTWAGGVNQIEFMGFGYGSALDYMYGQWMMWATYSSGYSITETLLVFNDEFVSDSTGRRIISGNLSGYSGTDRQAVADHFADDDVTGQAQISILVDSSTSYYRFFIITLNKERAIGRVWVFLKDDEPSGNGSLAVGSNVLNGYEISNILGQQSKSANLAQLEDKLVEENNQSIYEAQKTEGKAPSDVLDAFNRLKTSIAELR